MKINDVVDNVCLKLPKGYVLSIVMERGDVRIDLVRPDGETVNLPRILSTLTFGEHIETALRIAHKEYVSSPYEVVLNNRCELPEAAFFSPQMITEDCYSRQQMIEAIMSERRVMHLRLLETKCPIGKRS